jgi:hypothetical protein
MDCSSHSIILAGSLALLCTSGAVGLGRRYSVPDQALAGVAIGSPVDGVIASLLVELRDVVTEGQIIATLESSREQAAVAVAKGKAELQAPLKAVRGRLSSASASSCVHRTCESLPPSAGRSWMKRKPSSGWRTWLFSGLWKRNACARSNIRLPPPNWLSAPFAVQSPGLSSNVFSLPAN